MDTTKTKSDLSREVQNFAKKGFSAHFGQVEGRFKSEPAWLKLRKLGTELWLDSGDIEDIRKSWSREFSALTINNTLLNKEIQTGRYDSLIADAKQLLDSYPSLTEQDRILEINFILNAWHGLRLVEKFDAHVSLELHTDLANDVDKTLAYARRCYAVCPQRFYIKIPFTAAGLIATRILSNQNIPVNHTLGFSARQNYIIARLGNPAFLNVFLGRLNSFVANNDLGDGSFVGEKATLASQAVVSHLREKKMTCSRQIGASFRQGQQINYLAGVDVMTIPPKVAREFISLNIPTEKITDKKTTTYKPGLRDDVNAESIRLDTLWQVDDQLINCVDKLEKENLEHFQPDDMTAFFCEHHCGDSLVRWTDAQIRTSAEEGKIPNLTNWAGELENKYIGLDSLMNLAGFNSFSADQKAMDDRVKKIWSGT